MRFNCLNLKAPKVSWYGAKMWMFLPVDFVIYFNETNPKPYRFGIRLYLTGKNVCRNTNCLGYALIEFF